VDRFVVLSGCSGGGKSTLLSELGRRGYRVVEELALQHLTGEPVIDGLCHAHRYNRHVFLTPLWPEIYERSTRKGGTVLPRP